MLPNPQRLRLLRALVFAGVLAPLPSLALTPGWYLGAGYGQSALDPTVPFEIFEAEETEGEHVRAFVGFDLDDISSVEFTVSELGEAVLSNDDTVTYRAADLTGLYRFYDYRHAHGGRGPDLALFARLGLGYLHLDSETDLEPGSRIHMLAGAGAELRLFGPLGLRADVEFYDADALAASVSLLMRFAREREAPALPASNLPPSGTATPRAPASVPPVAAVPRPTRPLTPPVPVAPAAPEPVGDSDGDGVADDQDRCTDSTVGYPVRADGCALFNGVLTGLKYTQTRTGLTPDEQAVLRGLASLLKKYPAARVQLISHSASTTSDSVNLAVSRERLKKIGRFLLNEGVPASQTRYLAYGSRAASQNRNPERIEIREFSAQ